MIWLLLGKPIAYACAAAVAASLAVVLDALAVWYRMRRPRRLLGLRVSLLDQGRRQARLQWVLVLLVALFTWSLFVVIGLGTLVVEYAR